MPGRTVDIKPDGDCIGDFSNEAECKLGGGSVTRGMAATSVRRLDTPTIPKG